MFSVGKSEKGAKPEPVSLPKIFSSQTKNSHNDQKPHEKTVAGVSYLLELFVLTNIIYVNYNSKNFYYKNKIFQRSFICLDYVA